MFAPPRWIQELVGHTQPVTGDPHDGLTLSVTALPYATFVRVRAHELCHLDSPSFEQRIVQAYRLIAAALRGRPACYPVRFWNQIPGIHTQMSSGTDRYVVFNSARFTAFQEWFGDGKAFDRSIATATGVGHDGQDVVIDALASDTPGIHVQNPRQRQPVRYSKRFGPFPPCFARGTITHGHWSGPRLLIGGTASVQGEESMHRGDLTAQTAETFCNLASLVRASVDASRGVESDSQDRRTFAAIESARVYYSQHEQAQAVRELIEPYLPHLSDVEYVRADLCRAELLIEIEGVARIETLTEKP